MKTMNPTRQKRRRNCWDRFRKRMYETRRARHADPAQLAAAQLLGLFMLIFGRMPVQPLAPAPYVAPPMSPGHARRIETARRLGVGVRYVDVVMAQGCVPYCLLFDHIRRGGTARDDAMKALRQRVPDAALDWLAHIRRWGLWSELSRCYDRDSTEEETDVKILRSALAWIEGGRTAVNRPGPDDAVIAFTPDGLSENKDPGDDPDKPKP